jgi:oligopeptide transport system substrate-binding protein
MKRIGRLQNPKGFCSLFLSPLKHFPLEDIMRIKRYAAFLLSLILLLSLCLGCERFSNPAPSPTVTASSTPVQTPTPPPTPEPTEPPRAGYHTLHLSAGSMPACWDPHSWQSETDYLICSLTAAPLVNIGLVRGADGKACDSWIYEMAESVEDVTGEWEGSEAWGIGPEEQGRVWRIRLRDDACWDDEDATPITADSYLYSMRCLLSPAMENYRATVFCTGAAELMGANAYLHSGADIWEENALPGGGGFTYPTKDWSFSEDGSCAAADGTQLYFSLRSPLRVWLDGSSLEDYYRAGYVPEEVFSGLSSLADAGGYVPVTQQTAELLYSFTGSDAWGREKREDLAYYTAYRRTWPVSSWENVGLLKEDDLSLLYICAGETEEFDLLYTLTTPWLVYEPLYESGRFEFDGRSYTSYGTSPETSISCGPYRVTEMTERSLTLKKNEAWCSRFGGGAYETDCVILELLSRGEAEKRFREGDLDLLLPSEDGLLPEVEGASVLMQDDAYTYRFFMVTDPEALEKLEIVASVAQAKPINKTCLSNDAFREALSFALDRAAFAAAAEENCRPQLGVISGIYLYDVTRDLGSRYRTSPFGMAAVCSAYGVGVPGPENLEAAYRTCTGYDPARARRLFQLACEQMEESGLWTEDMSILLDCAVSGGELSEAKQRQNELVQQMLDKATEGTGFEGKLRLRFCTREDRYTAVASGEIEMGYGAWGGAAFDPYGLMQCYCDPDFNTIQEGCGFDPEQKLLTLLLDDEPVTRTYAEWCRALLPGGECAADAERRVQILGLLEEALLRERRFIVAASGARKLLLSPKLQPGSENYSILSFFGGVRSLKYLYDDAQWAERG